MVKSGYFDFLFWIASISCLVCVSSKYTPEDNYLIDCGSSRNNTVEGREFASDQFYSSILRTPQNVTISSGIASSTDESVLYQTARFFYETSEYIFSIKKTGRHWIRLHFYPFVSSYNLSLAKFSVSAQNFTLFREYQPVSGFDMREYSLNVTTNSLVLTFAPNANSFAFVNAVEVISLPDELTPEGARAIGTPNNYQILRNKALETVERVNMGNHSVSRQNDTLWRFWVSDDKFFKHRIDNIVKTASNFSAVRFDRSGAPTERIAPVLVYGSATQLNSDPDPNTNLNVTWLFDVDPGFEYLVRFHFCDVLRFPHPRLYFNVYIGSLLVEQNLDLQNKTGIFYGAPYFLDVITRVSGTRMLNVSVGPSDVVVGSSPTALLNGLEIMKISNSKNNFDALDFVSSKSSKVKVIVIVCLCIGLFVAIMSVFVLWLLCRRRRKLGQSKAENGFYMNEGGVPDSKYPGGTLIFSTSKFGYRFPFVAIQEGTDNFSENLVVGVGGFGKVYKGVLRDETVVAVKRGTSQSQGVAEFRTEVEMLSQFRHRHLVSLIGYCDERNELIIIYEYMENGTLKDHLYGTDRPRLSWRKRLEICIGAAKGLHYLHTGSTKAIIHRDVKSANILLDENFMAKVADFGLSKTGPEFDQSHVSTAVKGSFGYLDPEYLIRQQLTEKSDIYSFGVVLFEVLCGRPVIDPSLPREQVNMVEWALKCQKSGRLEEIVDPNLEGQIKAESLIKFGEIAEKCLAERSSDRPSMGDVLWNLEFALQLQGSEEKNGATTAQLNHAGSFQSSIAPAEYSTGALGDLNGVSMSKVFAQMVREEMR